MARTSVHPPLTPLPGSHEIPPEDLQTICKLYQKCPKLWADFRKVISFLDLLTENPLAYKQLYQKLARIALYTEGIPDFDNPEEDLLLFAVAAGFVERSVQFSRQIMRGMGKTYITEFPPFAQVNTEFNMQCLRTLRGMLLKATTHSSQFCLRLAQTGFFKDLMEDVKHIKHLSGEALERGDVFYLSLGTIDNCLRHPDVIPIVKQMDIVPHVATFLDKRSPKHTVKAVALLTLSYIVDETQLDLLRLDFEMLQFFLNNIQDALETETHTRAGYATHEMIRGLSLFAKNDFNKIFMVAQGAVNTMVSVLESSHTRPSEEKRCAVTLLTRLITDPLNRQVCQTDGHLKALTKSSIAEEVKDLLALLEQHDAQSGLSAVKKILQRGETEEQTQAAKVVLELVSCEESRVIVKNDDALMASLREFTNCTCPELQQVAENVLQALNS